MLFIVLSCCLIGLVAGLLAGLFGIGGGLIIVPGLVMVFSAQHFSESSSLIQAVATSLATIVLTALSSVYAHHRLGTVLWFKVWRLAPMIMLGAGVGAVVAEQLPVIWLRLVIVVFLVYAGLQLVLSVKVQPDVKQQSVWLDGLAASVIGLLSAIVGIGGGTLTVPYLVYGGFEMRQAVAVSSACGLPIAIAGTVSYALLGLKRPEFTRL
ncbi:sulfite exporter TauE/SafE family protein [Methylocucumis oryzae]|uniref:sulfite exporter TauE/SafE family protein n=1 Tax=Methylocucumis oryzae TaxID=1632867 RepID=UPI000B270A7B|nr:sulfite exporter TauE/SafE family protein [Methylocucumis oryzae]